MNYTELIGPKNNAKSIRGWINHAVIPSEQIVSFAEAWVYRKLRVRELRKLTTGAIQPAAIDMPLPPRYSGSLRLTLWFQHYGKCTLKFLPWHDFEDCLSFDAAGELYASAPSQYTASENTVYFDMKLPEAATYRFWHTQALPPLSSDNPENILTQRFPDLLQQACLMHAYQYWKRWDEAARAEQIATKAIAEINIRADEEMSDMYNENTLS
jgi:hypothetical protein